MIKTEGIVLQATLYRESDRILTIFTQGGLLRLFAKGKKKQLLPYTVPLSKGEYLYQPNRSLPTLQDGTLIHSFPRLRSSLECIEASAKMVVALNKSQTEGKKATLLYELFGFFLEHLDKAPEVLYASFLLKILKFEGIWHHSHGDGYRFGGEVLKEPSLGAIEVSKEEEKILHFLIECRSLSMLTSISLDPPFIKKVELFFQQSML